ncbi:metallophosphoesterase [Pandoraea sputorum]|uniref:metallophosphoesterase n=1 Tax=Pandoraea sputorum TaxID=93222 RepID=UPI00123F5601|nr:metallophosphoesterase [Pandoraea sputorum]
MTSQALNDLKSELPTFVAQLRTALKDVEDNGGSHDLASLQECQDKLAKLETALKDVTPEHPIGSRVAPEQAKPTFESLFESLSDAAAALDKVRQEIMDKGKQMEPQALGWATKLLKKVGAFLGLVAAACVFVGVSHLAIPLTAAYALAGTAATLLAAAGIASQWSAASRLNDYAARQVEHADHQTAYAEYKRDNAEPLQARDAQLNSLRALMIRAERDLTIANIRGRLTEKARDYFSALLTPCEVDSLGNPLAAGQRIGLGPKTVALGDGDGSDFRVLLAAILSGHVSPPAEEQALLAECLQAEADCQRTPAALIAFQENNLLHAALDHLAHRVVYRDGLDTLILIGDVCHDRFSTNRDASRVIREALRARGAVFLLGNHDDYRSTAANDSEKTPMFGDFAKNKATAKVWFQHQKDVFVRIYYSPDTGLLGVHHGLRLAPGPSIQTPWGFVEFTDDPEVLVRAIQNNEFLPMPAAARDLTLHQKIQLLMSLSEDDADKNRLNVDLDDMQRALPACTAAGWNKEAEKEVKEWLKDAETKLRGGWTAVLERYHSDEHKVFQLTNFRPTIAQTRALAKALKNPDRPVTFLKGHHEYQESGDQVISGNARAKTVAFRPVAYAIRWGPAPQLAAENPLAKRAGNPWEALPRFPAEKLVRETNEKVAG